MGRSKNARPKRHLESLRTERLGRSVTNDEFPLDVAHEEYVQADNENDDDELVQDGNDEDSVVVVSDASETSFKIENPTQESQKEMAKELKQHPPKAENREILITSFPVESHFRWNIEIYPQDMPMELQGQTNEEWILRDYHLVHTTLHVADPTSKECRGDEGYLVTTAPAAECLLVHCQACCGKIDEEIHEDDMTALGAAVEDGTLHLECRRIQDNIVRVSIALTERAFQICSGDSLPLSTRQRMSRSFLPAMRLSQALAGLFPNTVIADMVRPQTDGPITAKMVYEWVDNVQLTNYETNIGYDSKPMTIPGLIPTLRPYQEAAVKWMLSREQGVEQANREWELAWVVLTNPFHANSDRQQESVAMSMEVFTGKLFTLPEWKHLLQGGMVQSGVLFCPFLGFLAKSETHAYHHVLGDVDSPESGATSGGILAESMGLGKTVEVIACVLANPYKLSTIDSSEPCSIVDCAVRKSQEDTDEFLGEALLVEDSTSIGPNVLKVDKWVNGVGSCICGVSGSFKGCLSMVLCRKCHRPMHGICAGFQCVEQLEQATYWSIIPHDSTCSSYRIRSCSPDRCPSCVFRQAHVSNRLIDSRATLIITPASIIKQWQREIRRHAAVVTTGEGDSATSRQHLKVVVYPGIRELCKQSSAARRIQLNESSIPRIHMMHPAVLADADVVLMTFDALMGDLGHTDDNPYLLGSSTGRRATNKRYRVTPSPLTCIKWWRVCLDEAQRVEAPTATSARMARKLASHHRWCVSGTPIGHGKLDDLYGLLLFLKLGPFSNRDWFQKCSQPCHRGISERIKHLLANVLWRSTKAHKAVQDQMGIPEQAERKILLELSSIEKHFYERQLEETLVVATDVMNTNRNGKKRKSADDLLATHLHKLRAACCHPQVGSSGIGRSKKKRKAGKSNVDYGDGTVNERSGVLSMDQILDRLIDDVRVKCEEAQRLAILHTNAMASLLYLKVEARQRGIQSRDNDEQLLTQCCRTYLESLDLTDQNATPSLVVGEAILTGSKGFLSNFKIVRDGKTTLEWQLKSHSGSSDKGIPEVWARLDFEGPAKKIIEVRMRHAPRKPMELHVAKAASEAPFQLILPRECVFQVSNSALGGEFVDVANVSLGLPNKDCSTWTSVGGFRTNKSKSWRVIVRSYDQENSALGVGAPVLSSDEVQTFLVGIEVQLLEADISMDSLQRLHILHNASHTMTSLLDYQDRGNEADTFFMSVPDMKVKIKWMRQESHKIESLYMAAAKAVHAESQRQLRDATKERQENEADLSGVSANVTKSSDNSEDCWDDGWWDDFLSIYFLYGSSQERESLCQRVRNDMDDFVTHTFEGAQHGSLNAYNRRYRDFPDFRDVDGLRAGLNLRLQEARARAHLAGHSNVIQAVFNLCSNPTDAEIFENSHCKQCRKDWNQKGPVCRHCDLEAKLKVLDNRDPIIIMVLTSLFKWIKDVKNSGRLATARKAARIDQRAEMFFELLKSLKEEGRVARIAWRTHFDLLSDLDEMNQCKRTLRLTHEGEDLSKLSQDELGSIVPPWDVAARYIDHGAKQAMALGTLRRSKDTLRYLKNQSKERQDEASGKKTSATPADEESCLLCLSSFEGERAVLTCGHSFHYSPCLEKLMARAGNHSTISCPLRCSVRTRKEDVMIATDKRHDDGSKSAREIKGSWGTKVTRLVSDVMDVSDCGEKSIVFSQWEDMLDVVEHALQANDIAYVRATSRPRIGDCVGVFRSSECAVLLLNVKNGAEGLTLVEATHVFMIEPLLNCGLDSQAINRIHRIGQGCKTYVHRYLVKNTIEIKIDKMRMERQEDQLEDAINESKRRHAISAGGIDGGFSHDELQDILR